MYRMLVHFGLPQMIHLSLPRGNVCGMSSSQMTFESQTRMRSAAILVSVHRFFPATTGKFGGRMNVFDDSDDEE